MFNSSLFAFIVISLLGSISDAGSEEEAIRMLKRFVCWISIGVEKVLTSNSDMCNNEADARLDCVINTSFWTENASQSLINILILNPRNSVLMIICRVISTSIRRSTSEVWYDNSAYCLLFIFFCLKYFMILVIFVCDSSWLMSLRGFYSECSHIDRIKKSVK